MFKRILLPTDGSEQSERAILAAVAFAKELGAEVLGLTVVPQFHTFTYHAEMVEDTSDQFAVDSAKRAVTYLEFISGAAREAGIACTCEQVMSDDPWKVIVDAAVSRQCDLIAMGSHGRRGIAGVLLGSQTQKVLVHSKVPVLIFR
ncbi:universal stress protein [Massilia sp. TWR1-2-2]|uniref:universal stress protein n=1 Tax=Massilia sp. TWR1-2-2 TaxID=2804584 RepID=UPI003CF34769